MTHPIIFSGEFDWKGFSRIGKTERERIRVTIESKLAQRPELFGKPLRFGLRGSRSLRVGDYRVFFMIKGKNVVILSIGHRSKVY